MVSLILKRIHLWHSSSRYVHDSLSNYFERFFTKSSVIGVMLILLIHQELLAEQDHKIPYTTEPAGLGVAIFKLFSVFIVLRLSGSICLPGALFTIMD